MPTARDVLAKEFRIIGLHGREHAERFLSALDKAGYAVVPTQPTGAMLANWNWPDGHMRSCYQAMLSAHAKDASG